MFRQCGQGRGVVAADVLGQGQLNGAGDLFRTQRFHAGKMDKKERSVKGKKYGESRHLGKAAGGKTESWGTESYPATGQTPDNPTIRFHYLPFGRSLLWRLIGARAGAGRFFNLFAKRRRRSQIRNTASS